MYRGLLKKIILVLILILLIICIARVAYMYIKTDAFKTPEQLFYKYIMPAESTKEMFSLESISNRYEKKLETPLEFYSEITKNSNEDISLNGFKLSYKLVSNPMIEKAYREFILSHQDENIVTIKCVKNANKYAIKPEELTPKYLVSYNNRVREVLQEIGYEKANYVTDKIKEIDLKNFIELNKEDKKYIEKKFKEILKKYIMKECFILQEGTYVIIDGETIKVDAYTLKLTEQQRHYLVLNFLKEIQEDERILEIISEKADIININLDKQYIIDKIQEFIVKEENGENATTNGLKISVYITGEKKIRTQIDFIDEKVIKIDINKANKIKIIEEQLQKEKNTNENEIVGRTIVEIAKEKGENYTLYDTKIVKENENEVESNANLKIQISEVEGKIQDEIYYKKEDKNKYYTELNYKASTEFKQNVEEIETLDSENSIMLNELEKSDLDKIINRLKKSENEMYKERIKAIKQANVENMMEI